MKAILTKILILSVVFVPMIANSGQNKNSYHPPFFADSNRLTKIETLFPKIDKIYRDYAKANHFPGYIYGIIVDGELVHYGSAGVTNLKTKTPVTKHSMFRIASMTKSFTAMAILKLRDEGKLHLDDPVYRYIPEIKNQKLTQDAPELTIRDLMSQASGFPQDDPWADRNLSRTDEELIAIIQHGLSFSNVPGTQYEYSNLAFSMLGYIIKKVSGVPYQDYIAKHIWQPLGMQASWEFSSITNEQLAQGYQWMNDTWQEEPLLHDGSFGSMGGMITSLESFSRYMALHQSAWPARDEEDLGPIKRSSLREMHQPWRFNDINSYAKNLDGRKCPTASAYGYGLRWFKQCDGQVFVGHSGGLPGFGSNWFILPDYGIGVVLFANVTYADATDINVRVINKLIKEAHLAPRQLPVSNILMQRKAELIKFLPDWKEANKSHIFAENFFLDNSLDELKKETQMLFAKAGKIGKIGELVPENQLRGHFIMQGENANLKVCFTMNPQKPALIQKYYIKMLAKTKE